MLLSPLVNLPSLTLGGQPTSSSGTTATGSVQAAGATTSPLGNADVLIAEIGAGRRWKQANFPIDTFKSFFGVSPTASQFIELYSVSANGTQSPPVNMA
jgi:hypothetical protein